ncbi:MAG: hypothetical protein Q8P84_01520 [Deltaproteobacteria bacterium]|nr:hypothetical protein [Deltaproteobacteria bacterium]
MDEKDRAGAHPVTCLGGLQYKNRIEFLPINSRRKKPKPFFKQAHRELKTKRIEIAQSSYDGLKIKDHTDWPSRNTIVRAITRSNRQWLNALKKSGHPKIRACNKFKLYCE